jgi:hypothetical protein
MGETSGAGPATVCPPWCRRQHGDVAGEDDLVHVGRRQLVGRTAVLLCMSVHPDTGETDGPVVLVGEDELSLADTAVLADLLARSVSLAATGGLRRTTPRAGGGRRSAGP